MLNAFRDFLRLESASGIILVVAAALAMIIANSPLAGIYGLLAFERSGVNLLFDERLGIIAGSLLSAAAEYLVLNKSLLNPPEV